MPSLFALLSILLASNLGAQPQKPMAIEKRVISKLWAQYKIHSKVIQRLDLTEPFRTRSQWTLIVAKQPDNESSATNGFGDPMGAIYFCFVKQEDPDCSHEIFRTADKYSRDPFYQVFSADVVHAGPEKTLPLLRTKTCGTGGVTGNCGVTTYLLTYDQSADRFRAVFSNVQGRNNNEETRFIESGPLLGHVIVVYPTDNAPFTYFVEIYKQSPGGQYAQVFKYRGATGYADGNILAVIDSQMPETLRRLGLWKEGDPLPLPPRLPRGCATLVLRKGLAWCQPRP